MRVGGCATAHVWSSEDNLWESVTPFQHVGIELRSSDLGASALTNGAISEAQNSFIGDFTL